MKKKTMLLPLAACMAAMADSKPSVVEGMVAGMAASAAAVLW